MSNDYTIICIYSVLFIILTYVEMSVIYLNKKTWNNLMTNYNRNIFRNNKMLKFDAFTALSSYICIFYLGYYYTVRAPNKSFFNIKYNDGARYIIYTYLIIYFGFSVIRVPSFYSTCVSTNISVRFVLFMIAVGSIFQIITLCSMSSIDDNYDKLAIFCGIYIFFQNFIMDFIMW